VTIPYRLIVAGELQR